jgi:hypothetical protein
MTDEREMYASNAGELVRSLRKPLERVTPLFNFVIDKISGPTSKSVGIDLGLWSENASSLDLTKVLGYITDLSPLSFH